jgi:hypothetical protein
MPGPRLAVIASAVAIAVLGPALVSPARAAPATDLDREIGGYADEDALVEKARLAIARLIEQGNPRRAYALAVHVESLLEHAAAVLLDDDELIILPTLAGDFGFLPRLPGGGPMFTERGYGDRLTEALLGRIGEAARAAERAPGLAPADREVLGLLFTYLQLQRREAAPGLTERGLSRRGEAFLQRYPATPHRPFVEALLIERFEPRLSSLHVRAYGAWPRLGGAAGAQLAPRPGLGFTASVGFGRLQVGGAISIFGATVDSAFDRGGVVWPAGARVRWISGAPTLGYPLWRGRHRLVPTIGLGEQQIRYAPAGAGQASSASFVTALLGLEYSFALLRSQPVRWDSSDHGLLVSARLGLDKALVTRALGREISPLVLLLQVGLGWEGRLLGWPRGG